MKNKPLYLTTIVFFFALIQSDAAAMLQEQVQKKREAKNLFEAYDFYMKNETEFERKIQRILYAETKEKNSINKACLTYKKQKKEALTNINALLAKKEVQEKINEKNTHQTILHKAVFDNQLEIVKLLTKTKDIDLNAKEAYSWNTPLHIAATKGFPAITKLLIQKDANLRCQNKSKQYPICSAFYAFSLDTNKMGKNETLYILRSHMSNEEVESTLDDKLTTCFKNFQENFKTLQYFYALNIVRDKKLHEKFDALKKDIEICAHFVAQTIIENQKLPEYLESFEENTRKTIYEAAIHKLPQLLKDYQEKILKDENNSKQEDKK